MMNLMDSKKIHNTNILPLRWFANMCESISGWAILRLACLDENENFGLKYKFYSFIHRITWPVSRDYGTFYLWEDDLSGPEWNDYDENGHPYWFYTEWQEDPVTGDAWKLIRS